MKSLLKDPDLARLFENTFPNTLGKEPMDNGFTLFHKFVGADTTVKYFSEVRIQPLCTASILILFEKSENLAFIITGVRS